jgi:ABC-type sugar transport system substrate-binding protein
MIDTLVRSGLVDGIGVSVLDKDIVAPSIDVAVVAGIPVVTFDSDAPSSKRIAYIGSDDVKFGEEIGKSLIKIDPLGGKYGIIIASRPQYGSKIEGNAKHIRLI